MFYFLDCVIFTDNLPAHSLSIFKQIIKTIALFQIGTLRFLILFRRPMFVNEIHQPHISSDNNEYLPCELSRLRFGAAILIDSLQLNVFLPLLSFPLCNETQNFQMKKIGLLCFV